MQVYRIASTRFTNQLNGEGAFRFGGRWNSKGTRVVYTSESIALAMLELIVHSDGLPIRADMELLTISIPDKLIEKLETLPDQWNQVPAHNDSRLIGDAFVAEQRNLSLSVPSVVVPESRNYIINPMHPKMNQVKIVARRPFVFDGRI